jgi:TonB family protein
MALPSGDWLTRSLDREVSFPLLDGRILATFMPQPDYPERARQEARQGAVELEVAVQPDGRPARVVIARSSGSPDLDAAACSVVFHRWRFRKDAQPRRCLVRITFQLNRSAS